MTELCKEMARLGKGIGNENRFTVLQALMKGPHTVGEVAKLVKLPQPAVSQHLKILKEAELVVSTRMGQEVIYSVNVGYMAELLKKLSTGLPPKK